LFCFITLVRSESVRTDGRPIQSITVSELEELSAITKGQFRSSMGYNNKLKIRIKQQYYESIF